MGEYKLIIVRTFEGESACIGNFDPERMTNACARAYINPVDAEKEGLCDGDNIVISSGQGEVVVRVFSSKEVLEGHIVMPLGVWSLALLPPGHDSLSGLRVKVRKAPSTAKPLSPSEIVEAISLLPL